MTEANLEPVVKPAGGGVQMEYYFRLSTVSDSTFIGECKKISKEKSLEGISATIALILLGANRKKNDPYMLDSRSRAKGTGFDMQTRGPRPPKTDNSRAASQAPEARANKKAAQ